MVCTIFIIQLDSIVDSIRDVLLHFQIPTSKIRGQCCDGCNTMAGVKGGVAAKIQQIEPKAKFTHCYGHALNLSVNDTIKGSAAMQDCLDTCFEIVKLIKFLQSERLCWPKSRRLGVNQSQLEHYAPTRWTVRADSLASNISNYKESNFCGKMPLKLPLTP